MVTRRIGSTQVRLPAALVPKLAPGDVVEARFPDFSAPNTHVRYHVNVAFINESATIDWLYARSSPQDRLFASRKQPANSGVSFTYGTKNRGGMPIFFIVPEDEKTRGMDGVRDYVGAHPTDFKTMASSANETVDRYDWFHDFLGAVGSGSIDVMAGRARIVAAATGLGADPSAINACYAQYTASSDIQNCVESQLAALTQQTNFSAPTEAQFFGGLVGSATPLRLASYLAPLLTVWKLFAGSGRQEYEYLPVTLAPAQPDRGAASDVQLLAGEKVPTLRPPAAASSVLFFTIGEADAPSPRIVDDAPATGMCARTERVELPLHVDHTSRYLHDTALDISGEGGPARRIPVSPGSAAAPVVDRTAFDDEKTAGYRVRLSGRFGFDALPVGTQPVAYVAVPSRAAWTLAVDPHRTVEAGGSFDAVATSPSAPCLSSAELQVGGSPPVPLSAKPIDATHVALHASLAEVPPGDAMLHFYEQDAARAVSVEADAAITIAAPVAVAPKPAPQAALGDTTIVLDGSGLERAATLRAGSQTYVKTPGSSATRACFAGPALDGAVPGQLLPAELFEASAVPGPAFALNVLAPRPTVAAADLAPAEAVHFSNARLRLTLTGKATPLPETPRVLLRRAPLGHGPCAPETTAAPVDAADVRPLSANSVEADITPADVLGNDAFGALQASVVDPQTGLGSDWIALPGTFVRAPSIVRVTCPAGTAPCLLVGTHLESIAAVHTPHGDIAPDFTCVSPDAKQQCALVPRADHYAFVLRDGNTPYDPVLPPPEQRPG